MQDPGGRMYTNAYMERPDFPLESPRFGRRQGEPRPSPRAAAAEALRMAQEALQNMPATPPPAPGSLSVEEYEAEMRRLGDEKREAGEKTARLAFEVEQLVEKMRLKDGEIRRASRAKAEVEEQFRVAQLEQLQTVKGQKDQPAQRVDACSLPIRALANSLDCGPNFESELRSFVSAKQAVYQQQQAWEEARSRRSEHGTEQEILRRVRDAIYFKGSDFRQVFRAIDDDKSGELDYDEFRQGLLKCGAYLDDHEFEVLVKIVDNNADGKIQYIEFAETMKVPDIDTSMLTSQSPYACISTQDPQIQEKQKKWLERNAGTQVGPAAGGRTVYKAKPGHIHGLNMLPKSDIVRRLAEQIECRHTDFMKAFRKYDRNGDGYLDRVEFKELLHYLGLDFTQVRLPAWCRPSRGCVPAWCRVDQWLRCVHVCACVVAQNDFERLMNRIDADGNGIVEPAEWLRNFSMSVLSGPPGYADTYCAPTSTHDTQLPVNRPRVF